MARTKRSRRSYGADEWGRNRDRVFPDPKTGLYQMELLTDENCYHLRRFRDSLNPAMLMAEAWRMT